MTAREAYLDMQAVQAVRSGERERFRELVERYTPVVKATAMARVRNVADTEDVVQETFLRAFQSLDRLRAKEKFGPWLLTIARNVCITFLTRRGRETSLESAAVEEQVVPAGASSELDGLLHEELLKLSEDHREVLLMHYFAGKSLAEMESLLGVRQSALAKRLQRAREALGERMLRRVEAGRYRASQEKVSTVMRAVMVAPVSWSATKAGALPAGVSMAYRARQLGELIMTHKMAVVPMVILAGLAATVAFGFRGPEDAPSTAASAGGVVNEANGQLASVADAAPAGASAAAEPAASAAVDRPVDLSDPQDVWRKVAEVNRVWLDPRPSRVQYTLNMGGPEPGAKPELIHRVWIDREKGRWESGENQMVFDSRQAVYLQPAELLQRSPVPMQDPSRFRQGLEWQTALHTFVRAGLPENARIVETTGDTVVIEADLEKGRGVVGFGLEGMWFGQSQYGINKVRLHIRTRDFAPVLEQDFTHLKDGSEMGCQIEIGPNFFEFPNGLAPEFLTFRDTLRNGTEWVLRAEFGKVDGVWILHEGLNMQDGKTVRRIYVTGVSTEPFPADLVEMPGDERLAQLKATFPTQQAAPQPGGDQPVVVAVSPANGATNVAAQTELRIRFDRPMDPGPMSISFAKPGLRDLSAAQYDAESYEFVIPVRLNPGERHMITLKRDRMGSGFTSADGTEAARYEWGFETAPAAAKPDAAAPQVVSISPQSGETVMCFTYIDVTFDQPMDPLAGYVTDLGDKASPFDRAQFLADVQYDAREKRFLLPVAFPGDWQGDVELRGFKSADGAPAEPLRLHLTAKNEPFSDSFRQQLGKTAKDPQLLAVLGEMRTARQQMTSISERVTTITASGVASPLNYGSSIMSTRAQFKWQGDRQFYGDVTQPMMSTRVFVIASDGEQCWFHFASAMGNQEEHLQVAEYGSFDKKDVTICDPFGLLEREPAAAAAELNLIYEGTATLNGRNCHVIKRIIADRCGGDYMMGVGRWWIDAEQFLPLQVSVSQLTSYTLYTFAYDVINEPIADSEFAPPRVDQSLVQPLEPLEQGYTTRFMTLMDGSGGGMSVRWGMKGPAGTSSSGLN